MSKDKLGPKPKRRSSIKAIYDANNKRPWSLSRVEQQAKRCPTCRRRMVLPCLACEAEKREQIEAVKRAFWKIVGG